MTNAISENDETSGVAAGSTETTSKRKLVITGAVTAAIACAVCLVPAGLLVVAGRGALALFSNWLGYASIAILVFGAAVAIGIWQYKKGKRQARC